MTDRIYYSRDAERIAERDKAIRNVLFLGLGLGTGAILALLFAPKSGDKIREDLIEIVGDGFDSGRETTSSAIKRLETQISDLYQKLSERVGN